jgi:hypothetical protein
MYVALTVRKLKPGAYDEWRKAWQPAEDEWTEGWKKAYVVRNLKDPDEIIAFGFYDGDIEALTSDEEGRARIEARAEKMAPHIESIGADGLYEVVDKVEAPSGSAGGVGGAAPA